MRRFIAVLCALALALPALIGCGGKSAPQAGQTPDGQASADSGGVTLEDMRKAAEDSGYTVTGDYVAIFMKDVADGFAVEIVADDQDVIYSILECKTEDAAMQNAKDIDDAGHSGAIRSGKFVTSYDADNKDGTVKDILASILAGKPVS